MKQRARRFGGGLLSFLALTFAAKACADLTAPAKLSDVRIFFADTLTYPPVQRVPLTRIRVSIGAQLAPKFAVMIGQAEQPTARYVYSKFRAPLATQDTIVQIRKNGDSLFVKRPGIDTIIATLVGATIGGTTNGAKLADTIEVDAQAASNFISKNTAQFHSIGQRDSITAEARNVAGGKIPNVPILWSSSNSAVVDFDTAGRDGSGVLVARGNGTATVTLTYAASATQQISITVQQQMRRFRLSAPNARLEAINAQMTVTAQPEDSAGVLLGPGSAAVPAFTFVSDAEGQVSINPTTGVVTALGNTQNLQGVNVPAKITVRQGGVDKSDPLAISVEQVAKTVSIGLADTVRLLSVGAKILDIGVTATDSLGTQVPKVDWTSDLPGVAAVAGNQTATITAVSVGEARITAKANQATDVVVVKVTNNAASAELSPKPFELKSINEVGTVTATVRNAAGTILTDVDRTWISRDSTIALPSAPDSADANQLRVTARKVGSTRLVMEASGGPSITIRDSVTVRVTNAPDTINIVPATLALTAVGATNGSYAVRFRNALGDSLGRSSVTWSSTDLTVARVTDTLGTIAAIGPGVAYVLAVSPENTQRRDSVLVTVTNPPNSVTISPAAPANLTAFGQTATFTPTVFNQVGGQINGATVRWTVDSGTAVTMDSILGVATAVANGRARLRATSGGVSQVVRITVAQAISTSLSTFTPAPASIVATGATTSTITLQLKDANNNNIAFGGSTVAFSTTAGTLGAVADSSGGRYVAVLTSATAAATATVTGTVNSLALANSALVTFTPAPATKYLVTTTSTNPTVGTSVTITAQLADVNNNAVATAGVVVTWSSTGSGFAFGSATSTTDATGKATVSFTVSSTVGVTHTVTATTSGTGSGSLTSPITPIAASATQYLVTAATTSPAAGAGVVITAQLADASGNAVQTAGQTVTWTKSNANGSFSAATSSTDATGKATITLTTHTVSGTATTVTATTGSFTGTSATITTVPGAASKLTVTTAPTASPQIGVVFPTQPVLQLRDANDNTVNASNVNVTVTTSGGTLVGTTTVVTNGSGVATFSGLAINGTTGAYTLTFSSNGLTSATSGVTLVPGNASSLAITTAPTSGPQSGIAFPTQPAIQVRDASGNAVTTAGIVVTAAMTAGTGTLGGTLTASTNASGVATFTNLSISGTVGPRTLTFSASGTTSVTSDVTLVAGNASQLTVTTAPTSTPQSGIAFPQQPAIQLRDASSNIVTTGGVVITASATGLSGTTTATTINGTGLATFSNLAVSGTAGTPITITFSATGLTSITADVTPVAGNVSLAQSTITSNQANRLSGETATITVQLKDANGNNLTTSGGTVALSTNLGTLSAVTNNNNGTYTATYTATTAGSATISGTLNGAAFTGGAQSTASITVTPGAASTATSTVTASATSITANGTSTSTITVQLKDAAGNNLTSGGATVTISSTAGTFTNTVQDVGNGTYTRILQSSTTAGTATVTATVGGSGITDDATVTFAAGTATTAQSTITLSPASGSTVTVGTPVTVTVQLKDVNSNNTTSADPVVIGRTGVGSVTGTTNLGSGQYQATLTSTAAGLTTLSATLNAVAITGGAGAGSPTITWQAGAATQIAVNAGDGQTATAGSTLPIAPSVIVRDANGNPVSGVNVVFTATDGTIVPATASTTGINTNSSGIAALTSWTLKATPTGTNTLTATSGSLSGSPVTFTATGTVGTASLSQSTITSDQPTRTSGQTATITVQLKDANGNNLTTSGGTVALSVNIGTLSAVTNNNNGTYTATYTATTAGAATISGTLNGAALTGGAQSTASITVTAGAASAATTTISASPTSVAANGAATSTITVQAKDAAGNNRPTGADVVTITASPGGALAVGGGTNGAYTATLPASTSAGTVTISATIEVGGTPTAITSGNATVTRTAGTATTAQSTITLSPASGSTVTVGTPVTVTVQLKDVNGNNTTSADPVVIGRTGVGSVTGTTNLGSGQYQATLTSTAAGLTTLSATLNAVAITGGAGAGSPTITWQAGAATQITVNAGDGQSATAGSAVTVAPSVVVRDANGNPVASTNVTFAVAANNGQINGGTTNVIVATNSSGIAALTSWTLHTTAGTNQITATAAGLTGSPVTFTATGTIGSASLSQSTITSNQASRLSGETATITVQLKDANGNNLSASGGTVALSVNLGTLSAVTNNNNGTYTATYTATTAGSATISGTLNGAAFTGGAQSTASITVTAGTASQITVLTAPSSSPQSGIDFVTQPVIQVRDASGNATTAAGNVTASITSGGGTLSGTATIALNGSGQAVFTDLRITGTVGARTLTFTHSGALGTTTANVTLVAGAASQITVAQSPTSNPQSGIAFPTQPTIQVRDAQGNATTAAGNVTASITAGGGTLGGTATVALDGSGLATFTNLSITGTIGARTLTFTHSGALGTTTANVTLVAGTATQVVITTQPSGATAGSAFTTQPVVAIRDASGNTVLTDNSTIVTASRNGGTGTLQGTLTATAVSGVATFTNLRHDVANNITINFAAGGLTTATSNSVTVAAGTATALAIQTQPSGATAGSAFTTQPAIQVLDAFGNVRTGDNSTVVTATRLAGTASLQGTVSATASSGVATFTNLSYNVAETITIQFTSGALTSTTSNAFTVASATASQLSVTTAPTANPQSGVAFPTQPAIQLRDASGNAVATSGVTITASISAGGGTLGGTVTANTNASGLATFTNLSISGAIGARTLTFSAAGVTSTTANVTLVAGNLANFLVEQSGGGAIPTQAAGVSFNIKVTARDASGNTVTAYDGAGNTVNITSTGTLSGGSGTTATFTNGVLASHAVTISNTGSFTVTATRTTGGSEAGTSNTFTVNAGAASALFINTAPSATATAGVAFATQPVIHVRDSQGNVVTSDNTTIVTAAVFSGSGTLQGTTSVTAAAGVATFTNLAHNVANTITIRFTASGLSNATSGNVVVSPAALDHFAVTNTSDGNIASQVAGTSFNIKITAQDAFNNTVLTFTGAGNTVGITSTATLSAGSGTTATFTNGVLASHAVTISNTGTFTITATRSSGGTQSGTSNSFAVSAGTQTQLAVTTAPSANPQSGIAFPTQPVIQLRDANGNAVATSGVNVEATILSGGGTLGGTTVVATNASGQAVFTNLVITGTIGARTLRFGSPTVAGSTLTTVDASVTLVAGTATQLAIATQPSATATVGTAFATQPVIEIRDGAGNVVTTNSTTTVTATRSGGTGTLQGTTTVTAQNGVATFTNLSHNTASTITIQFTASGLTSATSGNVVVTGGTDYTVTPAATSVLPSAQIVVTAQLVDGSANPVSQSGKTVVWSSTGGGSFITPSSITDASGQATIAFTVGSAGSTHTVTATDNTALDGTSGTITVFAADGSGTNTVSPATAAASSTGRTYTFTYTAATGGMSNGAVEITVPSGWTAPSTTSSAAGYVTASTGTAGVSGQVITVTGVTLAASATLTIVYGQTSGGGAGVTVPATTGAHTFTTRQRSLSGSTLTGIGVSPSITVFAADGTGTNTVSPTTAAASATATYTFTYTAAAGGMNNGAVEITVPAGWTAPSTTSSAAGYVTASTGTAGVSGQVITVTGVTLAASATLTIVYGETSGGGAGVTVPATTGAHTFNTRQRSVLTSTLTAIGASPGVTVFAADGTGTNTVSPSPASTVASATGNTLTFTYTAAAGGMNNGAVEITVPAGWSAPSLTSSNAGYTTASTGTVGVSGQVITVTGVTLAGSGTMTIVYGSTAGTGPGATAGSTTGTNTFTTRQRSVATSSLTAIGASPTVTVLAADGSGTNTVSPSPASTVASATGNTLTFTYTAAAGGMSNGAVEITVPAGWSAPSLTGADAGYTTASTGTVGVSGQVITVTGVTLAGSATMTIVYGSTASTGPGATAGSTTGTNTFTTRQRSASTSTLTAIGTSPTVTVLAADGTGTNTVSPLTAAASSTGRTYTFTYTAATGGMSSGAVEITVPAGWTAPSTTSNAAGYVTASTGTAGVSGQVITVTGVTLAASATLTIVYGETSGGGAGVTVPATTGAHTFTTRQRSAATSSLTNIAAQPSVTVFAADGSGTNTVSPLTAAAGSTGNTYTFTYTAAAGGMDNGAVRITVPSGFSAPSTTGTDAGYTTASTGTVGVSGQVITVTGVTLAGSGTMSIVYGSTAGSGPGATAGSTLGANTFTTQQRSVATSTLTNIAAHPEVTVFAADGSGTNTVSTNPATTVASATGNTLTFTYTAATGGMSNGAVEITVPAGWSAPSTTGTDAGYTTASTGTVGVSGQVITVTGVTLAGSATMTIVYGSTAGTGPGATAGSTTGTNTFTTRQRSVATSSLTAIGASPTVTVFAADGSGTNTVAPTQVAGLTGHTLTFTYTAAAGGMNNGAVEITVPASWSAPSLTLSAAGYTTATTGTVGVSGQVITVTGVSLAGSATMTIVYGSKAGGGSGATAPSTGAHTFTTRQRSAATSTLTNIAAQPSVTVFAADGSGTNTVSPATAAASSTGRTYTFTYTAATGGMSSGAVEITVPAGWTAPSTTSNAAGYVTASTGTAGVSGQVITVTGVTLAATATLTIVYGETSGGGAGVTVPVTTGAHTFTTRQRSLSGSTLTAIGASPDVTVFAADGSGTNTVSPLTTSASSTGNTLTFTYTAAAGGMDNGAVEITVPSGWSAPSTTGTNAGYTTATTGTVGVSGQVITVTGVTLAGSGTMTIVYGSTAGTGPGATAGSTTGTNTFTTRQRSVATSALTNIAAHPAVTVFAADGSGTNTVSTNPATTVASATGNTLTFTYTAATGGMSNGAVEITVPAGWSAPSLTTNNAGYTTATTGTVGVSGQVITVTGVTLAGSATVTIVYGSTAGAGPGATAGSTTGTNTFTTRQRSLSGSPLTAIGASPTVTVFAADGSGTNTVSPATAAASSTGRTYTFTYTAATGGMSSGAVEITVPAGWTAPSTTSNAAGYVTASTGTAGVSGQVITVTGVTLAATATLTIVYGETSGGGAGVTVPITTGAHTFTTRQRSAGTSTLTNITAQPSVTVFAADGSGTNAVSPSTAAASSAGNTYTFTYTAAAGGMDNGAVEITVPAGWSAPSTTGTAAGYTTASTGTVGVSGQVITVTGVTLAGSGTMSIVYGSTAGTGPGATVTATTGTATFTTRQRSVLTSTLVNLAVHPAVTVFEADGSGTNTVSPSPASTVASATGNTLTFTYTASGAGMNNGAVEITVPAGWSAPSLTLTNAGYTTASIGTVGVSGQVITVTGVTLAGSGTMTIVYGSTAGAGPGATAGSTTGTNTFTTRQRSVATSSLTAIGASPTVTVLAADGSGTNTVSTNPASTVASTTGNTLTFTYTAATGGMSNGAVEITVPAGWSAPSLTATAAGYTTATTGTVAVAGQVITVSSVTLAGSATMTIVYGSTAGTGPGATAGSTTGTNTFTTRQRSLASAPSTLTNIATHPSVTVLAADGSGTNVVSPATAAASSTGRTYTFTYTAAAGGMSSGAVEITVPAGWTAPSTTSNAAGYVTASTGTAGVSGQVITVTGVTLAATATLTIVYGETSGGGAGVTVPATTGAHTFTTRQRSAATSSLTNIAAQPSVTVFAADGSGTNSVSPTTATGGTSTTSFVFTYTAATGGMDNGTVEITVPAGWTAPNTNSGTSGFTASTLGTLSTSGQVITVANVTLAGSGTFTITYGSGGGPNNPTVPAGTAIHTFTTRQKSVASSSLTAITLQPTVTVP